MTLLNLGKDLDPNANNGTFERVKLTVFIHLLVSKAMATFKPKNDDTYFVSGIRSKTDGLLKSIQTRLFTEGVAGCGRRFTFF